MVVNILNEFYYRREATQGEELLKIILIRNKIICYLSLPLHPLLSQSLSSAGQDNVTSLTPSSYPRECDSCTPSPPPPSSDPTEQYVFDFHAFPTLSPPFLLSCMEVSPEVVSMTMKDISLRILEGLKADRPFSEDAYLSNVKQELRKIMKQRYLCTLTFNEPSSSSSSFSSNAVILNCFLRWKVASPMSHITIPHHHHLLLLLLLLFLLFPL